MRNRTKLKPASGPAQADPVYTDREISLAALAKLPSGDVPPAVKGLIRSLRMMYLVDDFLYHHSEIEPVCIDQARRHLVKVIERTGKAIIEAISEA